jgi:hypothetical protein
MPIDPTFVKTFFSPLYCTHYTLKNSALEARGSNKDFFAFSTLLDGLAPIWTIFSLKMQKKSKIGSPYCVPVFHENGAHFLDVLQYEK